MSFLECQYIFKLGSYERDKNALKEIILKTISNKSYVSIRFYLFNQCVNLYRDIFLVLFRRLMQSKFSS